MHSALCPPCYLPPPVAGHEHHQDATDPRTWTASDWLEIGGLVTATLAWIWRHTFKAWAKWMLDWFKMPNRIAQIEHQLVANHENTTAAIAMARATWDTLQEIPVWQSDALGMCVHVSKPMLRVLQRQSTEILGDNWRQIIHQPDRPMVYNEWDTCIKDGRDFDLTYHWVRSDGHLIKIHANANRIISASGEIIGWVSFVTLLKS